jgi:hypothetical protein
LGEEEEWRRAGGEAGSAMVIIWWEVRVKMMSSGVMEVEEEISEKLDPKQ